jgi:hypothetical protein
LRTVKQSALLVDLPDSAVLATLSAAVEVEFEAGSEIPRVVASDQVAYIIIDGIVDTPMAGRLGAGGVLFPESLVSVWDDRPLPRAENNARLFRIRADDFREVCGAPGLGAKLYQRLAAVLARAAVATRKQSGTYGATEPTDRSSDSAPPTQLSVPKKSSEAAAGGSGSDGEKG